MTAYRNEGNFEKPATTMNGIAMLMLLIGLALLLGAGIVTLRHVATRYDYDEGVDHKPTDLTLRGGADAVAEALREEVQLRVAQTGVKVEEAKLTHLAYAPEIAGAMLRRQQAEAIISARSMIVAGAVGMVEMALKSLSEKNVVELDDERRAQMVSNLMVVLCSERDTQPVVNAGTLYN